LFASIVIVHVEGAPAHAAGTSPLQPLKKEPPLAVAVSVTVAPIANDSEQSPGQAMPVPETVPEPLPAVATLSVNTFVGASTLTV
jgi:hypothetical protein